MPVENFLSLPNVISDLLATRKSEEAWFQVSTHSLGATVEEQQN